MNPFYIFIAILAVIVLLYLTGSIKFSATYTSSPPENYEENSSQRFEPEELRRQFSHLIDYE